MVYLYGIFQTLLQAIHFVYHKLQEKYYVDKTSCNRDALRLRSDNVRNEQVIDWPTDCY
jgi:hypothetical protein